MPNQDDRRVSRMLWSVVLVSIVEKTKTRYLLSL